MGEKIKKRREELKMSQDELAEKAGISRQTVSAIETGKYENVMIGTLKAIARALGCELDFFLP
jgi:transcriptional regulator with XRE-family HTH domain